MRYIFGLLLLLANNNTFSQQKLTLAEQKEDFKIFKGALQESHAGLYYFISPSAFQAECDSIVATFEDGSYTDDFYLKLRFIVASLHHGHTRISTSVNRFADFKMAVLDSSRLYLPFQLIIINDKLYIQEDCSKEQLFPQYAMVKSINNISSKKLIRQMLPYMPADGINQTFKTYSLYTYFNFQHLFSLLYRDKQGVKVEIEKNNTHYYIALQPPAFIDSVYRAKNKTGISNYNNQLAYNSVLPNSTGYLRVSSFYKGFIENFRQQYEPFLDSAFASIKENKLQNLVVDIRNNEGGGDNYEKILFSYLADSFLNKKSVISLPGNTFSYRKYSFNLSDDIKAFIENPSEFLTEGTLFLNQKYTAMMDPYDYKIPPDHFKGNLYVLINGGSFSASTAFIDMLYKYRAVTGRKIVFIGEENGGDIYSQAGCAGQSYNIKLPNSEIVVDMPFLCFGTLNKKYPEKRLPDFEVYPSIKGLKNGKDDVLAFALEMISKGSRKN